jgi:anti-sigma factor ChrR (cupin superfamily)
MMDQTAPKPIVMTDMMALADNADTLEWQAFREGVDRYQIYGTMGAPGPSACLLRYAPGARVARHAHVGYEHIFVLAGGQTDDNGHLATGTLLISPPGTDHAIVSHEGCIVLAIYEAPVSFDL